MGTETVSLTAHRLGLLDQIPVGEGRTFTISGHGTIVVFRPRGRPLAATDAACPHRGGPLADGMLGDGSVVCPLHALRFSLDDGECATSSCSLPMYPVSVDDGHIVVGLPDGGMPAPE